VRQDRYYPALCAALVTASILIADPILEMGVNDDWSYNWIARNLAATGHFSYNGWVGAMLGLQAVWGALLIRLFGFSFTLLRLSTLLFAAGCAILLYRFARSAELNPQYAALASLTITLSPVFTPLSASYMTDIPGFFFFLATAWCALRALDGHPAWSVATALIGIAGGTVRQVVFFVPIATLPLVAWTRRRHLPHAIWAAVSWCATLALTALCLHWYNGQPYVFADLPHESEPWLDIAAEAIESLVQIAVCCLLLILPVLAVPLASPRTWRAPQPLILGTAVSAALLAALLWFDDRLLLGNIVTATGILGQLDLLGHKPWLLTDPIQFVLGAFLFLGTAIAAGTLFAGLRKMWSAPLLRVALILGTPCLVYTAAIVYRSVEDWILFDRYLIVLLPLLVIPLLLLCQQTIREKPPAWAWILLAIPASYGIATTHDYFAAARARLQAATTVTAAGIPRSHVSAGFEYDGWTELEQNGRIPSLDELVALPPRRYPVTPPYWFWATTRHVDPVYIVANSRLRGLAASPFPPISYNSWLPPFQRYVFTLRAPGQ
jgi:hypothetical protein